MKVQTNKSFLTILVPILFSFYVMGFVDIVNIATSYVKQDFFLNDKLANLLPMTVFLWFAIFSLPTGILMGKIGRKKTVLLSALITTVAMLIPLLGYNFPMMLITFALLGIGNTVLQVSLNPLLASVASKDKVTSMLTLGQSIKAIASLLGPVLVGLAVGLNNWKLIFPVYAGLTLLSLIWLAWTPINEEIEEKTGNSLGDIFALLKDKYILALFMLVVLIVGIEIGIMTTVPKYLLERCNLPLEKGILGCSLYYVARMIGTFIGAILLVKISSKKFFIISMAIAVASMICFMLFENSLLIMGSLFVLGLACSNAIAIVFSKALGCNTSRSNDISALMIMGVAGGALLPPVMGAVADVSNQLVSLTVPLIGLIFLLLSSIFIVKN